MKKEEATITALSNQQGGVQVLICNLTGSNQLTHVLPTMTSGIPRALQDPQVPAGAHPVGHQSLKVTCNPGFAPLLLGQAIALGHKSHCG